MKGREGKGPPSTDLLVCFPSRAHLTLMPKPICSPARLSESSKRQHNHQHHHAKHLHHHQHHRKKSSNRSGAAGQASPLLWAKNKPISKDISEPTSPKVTCAGQIKVRSKPASSCKNWQSVMEEIERLHNNRKQKKRPGWVEALGFKKDIMQFLTCLRNVRFDFRCFGSFPTSGITSDDDEDDEDDDEDYQENRISKDASDENETSRTVFSKWFMVLQENNNKDLIKKENKEKERSHIEESIEAPCAPPPNALLLMRCRSAPAKSWLQEREEVEQEEEEEEEEEINEKKKEEDEKKAKQAMEEEKKRKENLVVMRYGTDFYKFSSDIAKETWVVGGIRDPLSRSRSWKR